MGCSTGSRWKISKRSLPRIDTRRSCGCGVGEFAPNTHFDLNYDSNPRGYFNENLGLRYRINNHGFRGPDYPRSKPPGVRRIALVGDSFAFAEGVKFEDSIGESLERRLNERPHESPVEVLNFGVSGAGTLAELSFLRHRGMTFEPDLVLWLYVLNDAGAGGLNLWEDFTLQYDARWLKSSYLASYLYARVGRQIKGRKYIDWLTDRSRGERDQWERSMRLLSDAADLARSGGAEFAVAIFPFMYRLDSGYPFSDFHEIVSAHCKLHDIEVLDLLHAFLGQTDTDMWVHPSDQHPNEIAHRIATDALFPFVAANLPGPNSAPPPGPVRS